MFTVEFPEPPPVIEMGFIAIAPPLPEEFTVLPVKVQFEIFSVAPLPTDIPPPKLVEDTCPAWLARKQQPVIFTVAPVTKSAPQPAYVVFSLSAKLELFTVTVVEPLSHITYSPDPA